MANIEKIKAELVKREAEFETDKIFWGSRIDELTEKMNRLKAEGNKEVYKNVARMCRKAGTQYNNTFKKWNRYYENLILKGINI